MRSLLFVLLIILSTFSQVLVHPEKLDYDTFDWQIPLGSTYRTELFGSIPFYLVQDSTVPVFSLRVVYERGTLQEPLSNPGVASLHAMTLNNGGSKQTTPSDFEAILELYALSLSVNVGKSTTTITISGLSDYIDTATHLVQQLLIKPRFDEERFKKNQTIIKEQIAHQFDTPSPILSTAWRKTMYPGTQRAQMLSIEDVEAITIKELKSYHKELLGQTPLSVAAAGAIESDDVELFMHKLANKKTKDSIPFQKIISQPICNTVIVHKDGLNQAYIATGFPSFQRPDQRYYPLSIFNQILGGGGFNTRLVSQVRSDAGLTYSIHSTIESNYQFPGTFNTSLFTKSESINHAIGLTQRIIKETAAEVLDPQEVEEKKVQLIESLPSNFRTAKDIAFTYQQNELDKRDPNHFIEYPKRLASISTDSIQEVAREYFDETLITVVVGDTTELFKAPTWEGYNLKEMTDTIISIDQIHDFGLTVKKD